jgi:hypothetical protein
MARMMTKPRAPLTPATTGTEKRSSDFGGSDTVALAAESETVAELAVGW